MKYKSKVDGAENLRDVNFFFSAEDEATAARVAAKNGLQSYDHTTFVNSLTGESPTRNVQINSMLLISPGWKLLSTKPLNGSVPLRNVWKRIIKINRRNLFLSRSSLALSRWRSGWSTWWR